jgi:hypothetical protein
MAQPDPLPPAARSAVAKQLGQFLAMPKTGPKAFAAAVGPELTESLAVCTIGADQVQNPPADLSTLVQPSGLWHHQIRTRTGPTHMAWSRQQGFGPDDQEVQQVVESPISDKLDRAMAWVDRHVPRDDATVRLLVIPAYYVNALAIIRKKKYTAVLVDQPPGFTRLTYEREYPLRDFLKRLAREKVGGTLT